ncbi:MAG: hypothetical protein ACP5N2_04815 [Candidatus Nanoarchaeia archaeon]
MNINTMLGALADLPSYLTGRRGVRAKKKSLTMIFSDFKPLIPLISEEETNTIIAKIISKPKIICIWLLNSANINMF